MRYLFIFSLLFVGFSSLADTPPPGTVNAKMQDGSGNPISSTVGALNVNVSNTGGLTTVNQGTAGSQSWLASITASALPANACKETGGNLATIASELGAPLAVSGTFFQATQPVSIAAPISIASFPASQTVNGSVSVLNFPATQPVSGTFWQSIQPVSGTVTANAGSGTFTVDASGHTVPVSGTFFQATQPISAASLPLMTGAATAAKQPALGIAGTPSSDVLTVQGATSMTPLKVDGSGVTQPVSGTFWQTTQPVSLVTLPAPASLPLPTGAATLAAQSTGNTALSTINTTLGSPMQETGGTVTANAGTGTFAVSGTFWQATQPVSLATLPAPASLPLPTGAATLAAQSTGNTTLSSILTALGSPFQAGGSIGNTSFIATQATGSNLHVVVDTAPTTAVTGTFYQATQPVSGTVTANAGTPTALTVHQATVTIGTSAVRLTYNGSAAASTRVLLTAQLDAASTASCYFGSSTVTTTSTTIGVQMQPGQTFAFNNDAGDYWAICGTASQSFHIVEQE